MKKSPLLVALIVIMLTITAVISYAAFNLVRTDPVKSVSSACPMHGVQQTCPSTGSSSPAQAKMPEEHNLYVQVPSLKEKIKSSPDDLEHLQGLANILFDMGKFDEALPYYEKIKTIDGTNSKARIDFAICKFNTGNHEEACDELKSLIVQDGTNALALYNLGAIYARLEQKEKAREVLEQLNSLNDQSDLARQAGVMLAKLQ